jgi:integrase/recombinase XerD
MNNEQLIMNNDFCKWLKNNKSLTISTITIHSRYTEIFLQWLNNQDISINDARYSNVLEFIDYLRKTGRTSHNINRVLGSVRYYYNFISTSQEIKNPVIGLYVRGIRQRLPINLLSLETLENIYNGLPSQTVREQRNKLIISMLIYQGVTTEELHKLKPQHIDLEKATIYIPSGRKSNSRTLKLNPCQIMPLHRYINQTRPQMITEIINGSLSQKPSRKPQTINIEQLKQQLFFSLNGCNSLKNSLLHLFKDLKKQNPNITDASQIRQSAITNWLKTFDLRIVQYMAGHRYVSSTERYKEDNLRDLQEALKKHHPLRRE